MQMKKPADTARPQPMIKLLAEFNCVAPSQKSMAPIGQAREKHKLTIDRSRNDHPLRRITEPIENASSGL